MSDDEIDPEIAAAMGFTSFGSKRRKHNAKTDDAVFVENASTGANDVALGVRSRVGHAREVQDQGEVGEVDAQHGSAQKSKLEQRGDTGGQGAGQVQEAQVGQTQIQAQEMDTEKGWTQGWPSAEELAALRRGIKNSRGDMVVFLPGFVEDPWRGLK